MGQDLGRLLLRIAIGGFLLFHGLAKLRHGVGPIVGMVAAHGLPRALAYAVYLGEVVAPVCLLLGVVARPAAVVIAINMIFAVGLARRGDLFHVVHGGYALELQGLYFFGALALALLGAGRYAIGRGSGRWS